jgi:hypothetical protein
MATVNQGKNPSTLFETQSTTGNSNLYVRNELYPILVTVRFSSTLPNSTATVRVLTGQTSTPDVETHLLELSSSDQSRKFTVRNRDPYLMGVIDAITGANASITMIVEPIED